MAATTIVGPSTSTDERLTRPECEALLRRVCFGHLAFLRRHHVEVVPIRHVFVDGWVYFRADLGLREVIASNPWLVLSVTEAGAHARVSSVIVQGGCYGTHDTGSERGDASALRGIRELRDRPMAGRDSLARIPRTSLVFRIHAGDVRGVRSLVPCPAGERAYDAAELKLLSAMVPHQSVAEDQRADNEGMASAMPRG